MNNKPAPIILAIDTSAKTTSIAVARGEVILKSVSVRGDETRSERLWSDVDALLSELELSIGQVDLFAVCTGPGGFTGLRIGIAAVKGFSVAAGKPVIGVTSLEAAALSSGPAALVCAMVNAYKEEVYSQLFSAGDGSVPTPVNGPLVSSIDEALERVPAHENVVFAGNGVEGSLDAIKRQPAWHVRSSSEPSAVSVAQIAYARHQRGESATPEKLKACYVRKAEAEIKLSKGLLGSKIRRSMKSR